MDQIFVRNKNVQLYTETRGAGPAVVFGHGLACSSRMFRPITGSLSDAFHTVTFDFRGHGKSSLPERWALDGLASDYLAVLDALDIGRAAIVGFSMGGMAALHLALDHPERVRSLVLIDTDADSAGLLQWIRFHTLATSARILGIRQFLLDEVARLTFSSKFRQEKPGAVREWQDEIRRMPVRAIEGAARMVANRPSVVDRLSELTTPVLVIVGSRDKPTPVQRAWQMADELPKARIKEIPGAGHAVPIERPGATSQLIRSFLNSVA